MTAGLETKIFRALTDRLDAYVTANPIDVAYPGKDYAPTSGTAYLKPWLMPAETDAFALTGTNEYRGIFQVSVFYPEGSGVVSAMETASALVAHFQRGTSLEREGVAFRLESPPSIGPALQEPGWVQIPVSIRYRAFLTP